MRIITTRPIYTEPTSNCCGMSSADGRYSNCCGMSSADGRYSNCCGMSSADGRYSNADDEEDIKLNLKTLKTLATTSMNDNSLATPSTPTPTPTSTKSNKKFGEMVKGYRGSEKESRKQFQQDYVGDVLQNKSQSNASRRTKLNEKRDLRQTNRSTRKEARFQRRQDRKSKKNAKKLALIQTQGRERYFFPLSRVRLGKKKYKDGTTAEVKTADQVTITTPTGEIATFDKNDIAKGLGTTKDQLTQTQIQSLVAPLPKPIVEQQNLNKELAQPLGEPVFSVPVPEQLVETPNDGELYLSEDVQNTNETEKDVKDEEKGLSKTQKIVLWSAGAVVLGIVGFIIYKAVTKSKTGI